MMIFLKIGWRNLWRNKRRSLVVISSIALGIFALILSMGLMNGLNHQMVENTISTSLGHISIHKRGFQDEMKLANSFVPSMDLMHALSRIPEVVAYAPRIKMEVMIRSSEASRGVLIMGIDPAREKSVSKIWDYMLPVEESTYLVDPGAMDILLSRTLAEKLDLEIGDKAILMFQDIHNEIIGEALTVKGLYQSPIDSFDKFVVYTGIQTLQKFTGIGEKISEISVRVGNRNQVDSVKKRIQGYIAAPSVETLTWKDMAPNLLRAVSLFDAMMYILFSIIFITVIFSVTNTLIMAIMERFHEIGVMKSIGTRPSWIWRMVLFEAINLGMVGLVVGISAGALVTLFLSSVGIDFSFYMESARSLGTGYIIYPKLKLMDILVSTIIVMTTTIIAALYPAFKAARIKPLDALHYV